MNSTLKEETRKDTSYDTFSKGFQSSYGSSQPFKKNETGGNPFNRSSLRFDFCLDNYKKSKELLLFSWTE
jgi:hypothetical protein